MDEASGNIWRTLIIVGVIALGAASLVVATHDGTKDRIVANQRARRMQSLNSVLDPAVAATNSDPVLITATDRELLGSAEPIDVFVIMSAGQPAAAIFASVAPDGYNAAIQLLVGVSVDAKITGVRAVEHRETPGLGDAIDIKKSDWIRQFDGKSLLDPPVDAWAVDKDEGAFDSITGATVTPRAVVKAVKNTLLYFADHHEELFAAAALAAARGETDD